MKITQGFSFIAICMLIAFSSSAEDVYVKGYYKNNGTYVAPHYRSSPNKTVNDNWSTYGNTNPHTGELGTKRVHDANEKLSGNKFRTPYYSSNQKMASSRDSSQAPVTQNNQANTNTLNTFFETLILFFLFTIFVAPIVDRGIINIFRKQEYYASLASLKSFVTVYILFPLIFNVVLHFYLLSD